MLCSPQSYSKTVGAISRIGGCYEFASDTEYGPDTAYSQSSDLLASGVEATARFYIRILGLGLGLGMELARTILKSLCPCERRCVCLHPRLAQETRPLATGQSSNLQPASARCADINRLRGLRPNRGLSRCNLVL